MVNSGESGLIQEDKPTLTPKQWLKKERGWKGLVSQAKKREEALQDRADELESKLNDAESSSKVVPYTHNDLPSYLPVCPGPGCESPNPNFRKEVKCDNCGGLLGAKSDLAKLKACPWCSATGDIGVEIEQEEE